MLFILEQGLIKTGGSFQYALNLIYVPREVSKDEAKAVTRLQLSPAVTGRPLHSKVS